MKTTLAALAALALAGSAHAGRVSFVPANTDFTASGPISFTISGRPTVACKFTIAGHTNADGTATVTSAAFSSDGEGSCRHVEPFGFKLGWGWKPTVPAGGFHWSHFGAILSEGVRVGHYDNVVWGIGPTITGENEITVRGTIHSDLGPCTISANMPITNGIGVN